MAVAAMSLADGYTCEGVGVHGGFLNVQEWIEIREKSRWILRSSVDRGRCMERMKRRLEEILSEIPGEIIFDMGEGKVLGPVCRGNRGLVSDEFKEVDVKEHNLYGKVGFDAIALVC